MCYFNAKTEKIHIDEKYKFEYCPGKTIIHKDNILDVKTICKYILLIYFHFSYDRLLVTSKILL